MLSLTKSAQQAVKMFIQSSDVSIEGLRITVSGGCSSGGMQYSMSLVETPKEDDVAVDCGAVKIFIDPHSAQYLQGVTVDFVDSVEESGFRFENPKAAACGGCSSSFSG